MITKALLATAGLVGLLSSAPLAHAVSISDSNVEEAIRAELGKDSGEITEADLAKVKTIIINGKNASKLSLPDGLVNLEELDLTRNIISPSLFNPVRIPDDLESLKILKLNSNRLPNLDAFDHLITLEELHMEDNGLEKIDVNSLPDELKANLKVLNLSNNDIGTFVLEEGFVNLEVLNLGDNKLSGSIFAGPVSFPNDLANLRELWLERNELGVLNVPAGLLSLEELYLERNELGSINFGGPLPNIVTILAFNNNLKKLTLPEGMARLDKLDLFGNQITELTIQTGLNEEMEPFIDLADSPLEKIFLPEGIHEDLEIYFRRWEEDGAEIFFIPRPLPDLADVKLLPNGDFEMTISGPTGTYRVLQSTDLVTWTEAATVVNEIGMTPFTSGTGADAAKFFRLEAVPEVVEE